jgi:hypothetical protein
MALAAEQVFYAAVATAGDSGPLPFANWASIIK